MKTLTKALAVLALATGLGSCSRPAADEARDLYMFTSFREPATEGLRFLTSTDGVRWDSLPGTWLTPVIGDSILRGPSVIVTPDSTFHLVWTISWRGDTGFGYARSKDLVHWSAQRRIGAMDSVRSTVNVWAPEWFYDDTRGEYMVIYSSCVPDSAFSLGEEDPLNNHRLWYVTTADFETFSAPRLFYDPGFSCIDATLLKRGEGDYVSEASYELGRSFIAQEKYAEGAAQLERFVADYPSSPRRAQALSDLGLAYLNLGNKEKSLLYYDMVVESAPHSTEAKEAMQGIREIYVSEGNADGYFDYAAKAGLESDLSALSRDSLSFVAAQNLYLTGTPEAAARSLKGYVDNYPKGYYLTDALYYLSDCYLRTGARTEAIETLTTLADRGTNRYTEQVLEKLSEMTFADKRYDEAASAYRRLYDAASTSTGREAAMTGYVRATVATGDRAKIEAMAADVVGHSDAGATALREARYAWAGQLRSEGRKEEAVKLYRELAGEVKSREGSEAAYYVIESLFESGDMDATEKAVFAYSDREPDSYWLAKAFLLLGDVYVRKGDNFQARATYQSVADGYTPADDGIVDEAKARIAKLN